ncbi:hypothetical protein [Adonisia turfae]|uniref:Uncharacterized protein n=1 Tax=Adonisia turfae CCMR0081 TaxID=2292702 RepID=A0A6M0RD96_9CYAN|nr:hypothetical protein [Adonisia turfae]NEZ54205.1 hypothetical protein [Adonisia turfae CCMR0081]
MEDALDVLTYIPDHHKLVIEKFLIDKWIQLAAECYSNYLQVGRGMMTVFVGDDTLTLGYVPWSRLQANWDDWLSDADASIRGSIAYLVPAYAPEDEIVLLFEFEDNSPSTVIRVTKSVFAKVSHRPGSAALRLQRYEGMTPKVAYETLVSVKAKEN